MNDASEKALLEAVIGSLKRAESMAACLEMIVLKREDTILALVQQNQRNQKLIDQMLREKHGAIAERPQFDVQDLPTNGPPNTSPAQSGGRDELVAAQRRRNLIKEKKGREATAAEAARPR